MSSQQYTIIIEQGQDGYLIGSVVELPGCRTQAQDQSTLMQRLNEAIALYLESESEPETSHFVGLQTLSLAA